MSIASGGVLRLASCLVCSSAGVRCKVASGASLTAHACTFRGPPAPSAATDPASSAFWDELASFHLSAHSPLALTLRECTFEGSVSTCCYVATSAYSAMAALVVERCTFRGGEADHQGSGGLTLRVNGALPRVLRLAHNQWLRRNLAITHCAAAAAPELAMPVAQQAQPPAAPFAGMCTVRCVENEFHGAALLAYGPKVRARAYKCPWASMPKSHVMRPPV